MDKVDMKYSMEKKGDYYNVNHDDRQHPVAEYLSLKEAAEFIRIVTKEIS